MLQDLTRKAKCSMSNGIREEAKELAVKQGHFRKHASKVDGACSVILMRCCQDNLQELVCGKFTNIPIERAQDVEFHLQEKLLIVRVAAHGLQLQQGRHLVLVFLVFGSNPERRTAKELVVTLIQHGWMCIGQ